MKCYIDVKFATSEQDREEKSLSLMCNIVKCEVCYTDCEVCYTDCEVCYTVCEGFVKYVTRFVKYVTRFVKYVTRFVNMLHRTIIAYLEHYVFVIQ